MAKETAMNGKVKIVYDSVNNSLTFIWPDGARCVEKATPESLLENNFPLKVVSELRESKPQEGPF